MEMKMRDVRRIERTYENFDFHAAQLFEDVKQKFDRMVEFYKNYGSVEYLFGRNRKLDQLLPEVVGSLQFMLSEYNELLTLVDVFRQSFLHWKNSVIRGNFREKITQFLSSNDVYPSNHKYHMQNKMVMIKRTARNYETTSDFAIASVYDDIQRRFKHMCDLYKQFATVERYVFGKDVNDTAQSYDVVLVYQIMLSDYNEILMILELLKMEQKAWSRGTEEDELRELIKKQMDKFLNIPKPPKMFNGSSLANNTGPAGGRRRWVPTATAYSYQQKWTGELDGVSFDNR